MPIITPPWSIKKEKKQRYTSGYYIIPLPLGHNRLKHDQIQPITILRPPPIPILEPLSYIQHPQCIVRPTKRRTSTFPTPRTSSKKKTNTFKQNKPRTGRCKPANQNQIHHLLTLPTYHAAPAPALQTYLGGRGGGVTSMCVRAQYLYYLLTVGMHVCTVCMYACKNHTKRRAEPKQRYWLGEQAKVPKI